MKKKLSVALLTAFMLLSVTACGGSDDAAAPADTVEDAGAEDTAMDAEAEPEAEDAAEAEDAGSDEAAAGVTLEELFSDPTVQSALEEQYAAVEEEGIEVSVDAKGNELFISFKFTDDSVDASMADLIQAEIDGKEDELVALVAPFDEAVGQEGACSVTMRYLDASDNVLAEKTCTAK